MPDTGARAQAFGHGRTQRCGIAGFEEADVRLLDFKVHRDVGNDGGHAERHGVEHGAAARAAFEQRGLHDRQRRAHQGNLVALRNQSEYMQIARQPQGLGLAAEHGKVIRVAEIAGLAGAHQLHLGMLPAQQGERAVGAEVVLVLPELVADDEVRSADAVLLERRLVQLEPAGVGRGREGQGQDPRGVSGQKAFDIAGHGSGVDDDAARAFQHVGEVAVARSDLLGGEEMWQMGMLEVGDIAEPGQAGAELQGLDRGQQRIQFQAPGGTGQGALAAVDFMGLQRRVAALHELGDDARVRRPGHRTGPAQHALDRVPCTAQRLACSQPRAARGQQQVQFKVLLAGRQAAADQAQEIKPAAPFDEAMAEDAESHFCSLRAGTPT